MRCPSLRTLSALATSLLLSVAAGRIPAQPADEPERPEVEKLTLRGVDAVDEDLLRQSISIKESRCRSMLLVLFCKVSDSKYFVRKRFLDRTEFKRDVVRIRVFYWKRGYRRTQVDTSITKRDDGVAVTFRITEGPPILVSSVGVERPHPVLPDRLVARTLRPRKGQPFNLLVLDSSVVHLRNALWDRGYADAIVLTDWEVVDSANTAAVRLTIQPGRLSTVGPIAITGNKKVSERTVRRSLAFRSGDIFKRSELLESQRNLYTSNLFSHAAIELSEDDDSVKHVQVTVSEAPLRSVRLSAGFNTVDFAQAEGRYTRQNWLGGARRLDVHAVVGNLLAPQLNGNLIFRDVTPSTLDGGRDNAFLQPTWQASVEVFQPWLLSSKNSFGASVFGHRRSAPAIFIDKGFGASASLTRQLREQTPLTVGYRFEVTEVEAGDIYFCVNYGVCERSTVDALRKRQSLSPLVVSAFTNRSNDVVDPTSGYTARLDVEHASGFTLSDFRYHRAYGETARYLQVGSNMVLAGRVRGGWVKSLAGTRNAVDVEASTGNVIIHPRKRFYAGGSQSVRGYGENQLGPRILTVDPAVLIANGCTEATILNGGCDPNSTPSRAFEPRPLGGGTLMEGSIELRFPIWRQVRGGVFVDAAAVGEESGSSIRDATAAVTPGFGVRIKTPLGPIRIDLGVQPRLVERLGVVTQVTDSSGITRIIRLEDGAGNAIEKRYNPLEGSKGGFRKMLDRLTLHFSIGQAF